MPRAIKDRYWSATPMEPSWQPQPLSELLNCPRVQSYSAPSPLVQRAAFHRFRVIPFCCWVERWMNDGNRLIPDTLQSSSVYRVPWSQLICCKRATAGKKPDLTIAWHEHGWQAELQRRSAFHRTRTVHTSRNLRQQKFRAAILNFRRKLHYPPELCNVVKPGLTAAGSEIDHARQYETYSDATKWGGFDNPNGRLRGDCRT